MSFKRGHSKLATIFYRAMRFGQKYIDIGAKAYEDRFRDRRSWRPLTAASAAELFVDSIGNRAQPGWQNGTLLFALSAREMRIQTQSMGAAHFALDCTWVSIRLRERAFETFSDGHPARHPTPA